MIVAAFLVAFPTESQARGLWSGTEEAAPVGLSPGLASREQSVCTPESMPGAVWWGETEDMSAGLLVSYLAPIIWFSRDEPSLGGLEGAEIRHPEPLPFDTEGPGPVLYYQITDVQVRESAVASQAFRRNAADIDASLVDLRAVVGLEVVFYAYYSREEGVGAHPHDLEPAAFRVVVLRGTDLGDYVGDCPDDLYFIVVTRSTGMAHGLVWFWNVLDTDVDTRFPMHLLVEEGKHAFGTDKDGDGQFTPGYDVNVRVNDAWGVRDNMRTGMLFSGGYQPWMTKVRRPEHRVMPPLPADSPLRDRLEVREDEVELATYQIRPLPSVQTDEVEEALRTVMENQAVPSWPELGRVSDAKQFRQYVADGAVLKSFSVSLYADGALGVSMVFPFFVVRHLNDPMTGGYVVHRVYLKNRSLKDLGWMIMYMPSASRWLDTYLGAGYEGIDVRAADGSVSRDRGFVLEAGLKLRANIAYSPLRFLPFTDFWGIRVGLKNWGFWDIERLSYVLEFGAGSF